MRHVKYSRERAANSVVGGRGAPLSHRDACLPICIMSIGRRARAMRLEQGRTQREVADAAGLAPSYLSRLENGGINPSGRTLAKLAAGLGVSTASFFAQVGVREEGDRCPVSMSGKCILEHALVSRSRVVKDPESYSREQLTVLREVNYILHSGSQASRQALAHLVRSLLVAEGAAPRDAERFDGATSREVLKLDR